MFKTKTHEFKVLFNPDTYELQALDPRDAKTNAIIDEWTYPIIKMIVDLQTSTNGSVLRFFAGTWKVETKLNILGKVRILDVTPVMIYKF